jgi:hypothetical protein
MQAQNLLRHPPRVVEVKASRNATRKIAENTPYCWRRPYGSTRYIGALDTLSEAPRGRVAKTRAHFCDIP